MTRLLRAAPIVALVLTVIAVLLVPRLRLSGDLARLFPDDPPARALGAYVRAFGGGDVTTILVRGDDPAEVALAADEIARALEGRPGIRRATTTLAPPVRDPDAPPPDPTLVWAFADDAAQQELATALGDDGMRARLEETRAMLLVPGGGGASTYLAHDPLRLLGIAQLRARRSVAATIGADASGDLVADGGRARFVLVTTNGSALRSEEAKRVVDALEGAIGATLPAHPGVRAGIAGGAAIARDAERMIRGDLYLSSALSTGLVALAFLLTFRRARALLAIGPPLLIGTLWTAAVAALAPDGVAAIAMGFASVVIGVGLDTGVHVYAAVMRIRAAEGASLSVDEVVRRARAEVARPTLTAAIAAAAAFGALGLSRLPALRQLGILCAIGEVLTAVAILALTPSIAARLERRPAPRAAPKVIEAVARISLARRGATGVFAMIGLSVVALAVLGPPRPAPAIVAMKPRGLPALEAQEEAIRLASGSRAAIDVAASSTSAAEVQLVVTQQGSDEAELLAR
ncbi:MAG: MMPL family transporter, partial [Polyangiales bacterium]